MLQFDANELIKWASHNGFSIAITFWEASGEYEVETISAAKAECFYVKRCYSHNNFITRWNEHIEETNKVK